MPAADPGLRRSTAADLFTDPACVSAAQARETHNIADERAVRGRTGSVTGHAKSASAHSIRSWLGHATRSSHLAGGGIRLHVGATRGGIICTFLSEMSGMHVR